MDTIVLGVLAGVVLLNGFASLRVLRNHPAPPAQRILQLAMIWLLPVVGAVVCLSFLATAQTSDAQELDREAFAENVSAYDDTHHSAHDGCAPVGADSSDGGGAGD